MKMRKLFKKGFTLVELVVVIAVIAVLAAVSVGAYFGVTDSANSSAAEQYKKQIKDLWIMYSVSQEYVEGNTDEAIQQNAEYFCLTYSRDNGPKDVIVNYRLIDVNPNGFVSSAKDSTFTNTGIIFLIDSQYDSYFVTCGQRIIAESGLLKSEEQFKSLMAQEESSFMSDEDRDIFKTLGYNAFELSNVETDTGAVLGYEYYQVNITGDKTDTVFVKTNSTLEKDSGGKYSITVVETFEKPEFNVVGREYVLRYQDNTEVDPSSVFHHSNISEVYNPTLIPETNNHYIVGEIDVKYEALLNDSIVNLFNYPICDYDTVEKEAIYFKDFESFREYLSQETNDVHYVFFGNTILENDLTIPSNYTAVIDHSVSISSDTTTTENIQQIKDFVTFGYHNDNKFDLPNINRVEDNTYNKYFESPTTFSGNELTIDENVTLTLKGKLLNEGIFHVAYGGEDGVRVTDASKIIMLNGSKINLSNTGKLRSIGHIVGEGTINTVEGSKIVEPFKPTTFMGGSNSVALFNKNIFPFVDYQIDSIKVATKIVKNAIYTSFMGLTITGAPKTLSAVDLIGSTKSLFIPTDNESYIQKSYNDTTCRTVFKMFGNIIDNALQTGINISIIEKNINSAILSFPLSNMEIVVTEGTTLTLQAHYVENEGRWNQKVYYSKYEIQPTTKIFNYGSIIIDDNINFVLLNKKDYSDVNSDNYIWTQKLISIFEANKENKILYNAPGAQISGMIYACESEDVEYQDGLQIFNGYNIKSNNICDHKAVLVTETGRGGLADLFQTVVKKTYEYKLYEIELI